MLHFKISASAYVFLCFTVMCVTEITTTTEAATDESFVSPLCPNASNPNTRIYYPNTTYQTNLNILLSWLSSNSSTRENGYYNTTIGASDPNNTIYGAFLCRGDITTNACQDCVSTAEKQVLHDCPVQKSAMIWFPECYVRYSDQSFFSIATEQPLIYRLYGDVGASEEDHFMQVVGDTMKTVADQAAKGGANKKFATKEANISIFQTLYTLAQCTPDLSQLDCQQCLEFAIAQLPSCCNGKQDVTVRFPSCNIRYELFPFYNQLSVSVPTPQPQEPPRPNPKEKSRTTAGIIIAILASVVFVSLVTFTAFWVVSTRARRKKFSSVPDESVQISSVEFLQFDFDTIIAATNNFCDDNKLGKGGFGVVYKGTLPNKQDIAVKRLSSNSQQGANEFKNEVFLLAKLQHRNLVKLLGFCMDGEEKMLIYEFIPNKSLDHFLFDPNKKQQLNWRRRYKIIEGIVRGILYLHEDSRLKIIHRDLKASNVLLNEDLNPKISDFGMAKIFGADQTQGNTNRIVGTFGYMPPEYATRGHFSVKVDIYSFGVLILEIISGKKITSFHESSYGGDLLNYAWKHWRDGKPLELLDMTLRDSYSRAEVIRCIHIGLSCVQKDPAQRPSMQTINLMLNNHSVTLATPKPPASYIHSRIQPSFPREELKNPNKSSRQSVSASVDKESILMYTLDSFSYKKMAI